MIDVRESLPAIEPDRLYTTSQLANALGVSPKSVTRYRRTGVAAGGRVLRLRAVRVGGVWRISGRDVLAWLEAQQGASAEAEPATVAAGTRHDVELVDALLDAEGF